MKKLLFISFTVLFFITANAQTPTATYLYDPSSTPREHNLDFTKLKVELAFVPEKNLVKGKVTEYFTPLRPVVTSFFLDGIKMNFKEVLLNNQPVPFTSNENGITFTPATPLNWNTQDSLTITYEATPRKGLYFVGWNDKNNLSRKQIWSQGEGIDNRYWIPMYDERNDKLLTETIVTFDKDYKVLSNGNLVDKKENNNGTITWHYAMGHPQSPYLIMLGIGNYDIKQTQSASGVPLHLYYYPDWKNRVEPTFKYSEAMIDFYEKEIGVKYPWESYSQIPVQDYMFGAMENTTATIFGDFYMVDDKGVIDRNYIGVNAHELAHQWFGDYVTARSDAHQWLQESFATYYSQMFEREVFGKDYFDWSRRGSQNASLDESTRNKFGVAHSQGGGTRIYGKGGFVLNMLKYVVGGSEVYNKAIKYYLEKHPYQNVDTHDLLIAFEETTGMDLDWFWTEWFIRGGEPEYTVSFNQNNSQLIVQQTHELLDYVGYKNGLYKMPIVIETHFTDGTISKEQYGIEKQTEIINLPSFENKKIDFVLFDPNNEILKGVKFDKPFDMLASQALKAESMLDRYDAITALRDVDTNTKRDLLIEAFHNEKFNAVKNEVILQLANDNNEKTIQLLKEAIADNDVAVKKTVLRNVNPIQLNLLPEFEKLLTDSSYELVETALQKLYDVNPKKATAYLSATKNIEGNVGKNVFVKWLEISYYATQKKQYADNLVKLTGNSYEFRTRGNAMAALKRMNYFNETLIANLIDASLSANGRLSGPANDVLRYFSTQPSHKKRIAEYIISQQWEDWQKKLLGTYF